MSKSALFLIGIVIALFFLAFASLVALKGWDMFTDAIDNTSDDQISEGVKDKINSLTPKLFFVNQLFVYVFVGLLIAYLVSSFTSSTSSPVGFLLFLFLLVFITVGTMILSNAWKFFTEMSIFSAVISSVGFIDFVMTFFPVFTVIIGLVGGLIFYSRSVKASTSESFGGNGLSDGLGGGNFE